ncbi:SH3 domain-containing protein [Lyngbya sp. CCY1209]|uniref:SH3 domain-containing protein n=1 Tax=Lyngbya sp. CCY1209 TaxID=2886103 RepID=UPI002D20ACF8|nr:SH3 domain-containing protein [Lyngbya sp. CCY1209]MEB3882197.1 SH3 domain-containing protein [Lyngbya sp. CCY1209]
MSPKTLVLATCSAIAMMAAVALPSFAYPARLTTSDYGSQINIRSGPGTGYSSPHYGYAGDGVNVINETIANDGYMWYYIEFYGSGARGWVRGDFITRKGRELESRVFLKHG